MRKDNKMKVGMKCGYCKKWFKNADYKHWNNCRIKHTDEFGRFNSVGSWEPTTIVKEIRK